MLSLSDNNQADVVESFISTPRYLESCLILIILISNIWYLYPNELKLLKPLYLLELFRNKWHSFIVNEC